MINKKTFEVRSRGYAQEFKSDKPWAAISVTTEPPWPDLLEENRVGLLQLEFMDAEFIRPTSKWSNGLSIFNEDHAMQILEFVSDMWDKAEVFMAHCDAGQSRSPAIAAAIENIYYGSGADQHWFNTKTPNMLVYRKILDVEHEKNSDSPEES